MVWLSISLRITSSHKARKARLKGKAMKEKAMKRMVVGKVVAVNVNREVTLPDNTVVLISSFVVVDHSTAEFFEVQLSGDAVGFADGYFYDFQVSAWKHYPEFIIPKGAAIRAFGLYKEKEGSETTFKKIIITNRIDLVRFEGFEQRPTSQPAQAGKPDKPTRPPRPRAI